MSLFRSTKAKQIERPSCLVTLKLEDKHGLPIDPSDAWLLIQEAFHNHKHLIVRQAEIKPDTSIKGNFPGEE